MKLILLLVLIAAVVFIANNFFMKKSLQDDQSSQGVSLQNSLLVDVRETDEFAAGHNSNSINIPLSEIEKGRLSEFQNTDKQNIVLVCRSGNRAGIAENILKQNGISKNIVNLGAWQNLEKVK